METATRYGIRKERAVNYNFDSRGTPIMYEAVAQAVCDVRANTPLGADLSEEINSDYQKRGKKANNSLCKVFAELFSKSDISP